MPHDPAPTADRIRRFQAKYIPEPNSGCWLWIGGVNEHGYGVFWNGLRLEKAHRFSLRVWNDPNLTQDEDVLHKCDTPACVNPSHLVAGSTQDNVDDMWAKSRATVQTRYGTSQTQAKLDWSKATEIRRLYAAGLYKQRDLAAVYDVAQSQIWKVVNFKGWTRPFGVEIERGRGKC